MLIKKSRHYNCEDSIIADLFKEDKMLKYKPYKTETLYMMKYAKCKRKE